MNTCSVSHPSASHAHTPHTPSLSSGPLQGLDSYFIFKRLSCRGGEDPVMLTATRRGAVTEVEAATGSQFLPPLPIAQGSVGLDHHHVLKRNSAPLLGLGGLVAA